MGNPLKEVFTLYDATEAYEELTKMGIDTITKMQKIQYEHVEKVVLDNQSFFSPNQEKLKIFKLL